MKIAGDTSVNIPAWSSSNITMSLPHCNRNGMVEPLDEPLKGGLLLQAGLVGSINGCFGVTIVNPTPNEVWLISCSPVGRIYSIDVIDRDPEHMVGFQELDDGLRVSLEPRQVTANTRWVSSKQSCDIPELPSDQGWMRNVSIGDIPPTERVRLTELLQSNRQVFAKNESDVVLTYTVKHCICTTEDGPVRAAYRHIPPPQYEEVKAHVNDLIQKGIVRPSQSEYANPIVICRKRNGNISMCMQNYRLNTKMRKDAFPLPRVDEIFDHLAGAKYFSTVDLKSAYNQVEINESDLQKTAFAHGFVRVQKNALWTLQFTCHLSEVNAHRVQGGDE